MDDAISKENEPQKYYLRKVCTCIYYLGIGDCWYEETQRSRKHKIIYAIWATFINVYLFLGIVNEILGNLRSDLSEKEKNDLIQFSLAHPTLLLKCFFLIYQKDRVRALFKRMVGEEKVFVSLEIENDAVKVALRYTISLAVVTYGTLFLTIADSGRAYFKDGVPFRTEVTFLPLDSSSTLCKFVLQLVNEMHWWLIITNMIVVDMLSFFSLVYLRYKFKLVGQYFESLGDKYKKISDMSEEVLAEEFEKDFIIGIKLHENALWCARNVQEALGSIYGVTIIETITLLVMCLLKLVVAARNMSFFLIANIFYMGSLMMITGSYMMVAGDVTIIASDLSESISHCGWELVRRNRRLRALTVVAIQQSQVPVYMTAFGVINLSHANFISVIRSSYSFYAVMY